MALHFVFSTFPNLRNGNSAADPLGKNPMFRDTIVSSIDTILAIASTGTNELIRRPADAILPEEQDFPSGMWDAAGKVFPADRLKTSSVGSG